MNLRKEVFFGPMCPRNTSFVGAGHRARWVNGIGDIVARGPLWCSAILLKSSASAIRLIINALQLEAVVIRLITIALSRTITTIPMITMEFKVASSTRV